MSVGRGGGLKIQRLVLSEPICEPTIEPFPETPMIVYGRGSIQACGFRRRDELPWVPPAGHHGTPTARCIARGRIRSGGIVAGRPDPCGEARRPQLSMRFANCRASDGQGIYVLKPGRLFFGGGMANVSNKKSDEHARRRSPPPHLLDMLS